MEEIKIVRIQRRQMADDFFASNGPKRTEAIAARVLDREGLDRAEILNFSEIKTQLKFFVSKLASRYEKSRTNQEAFFVRYGEYLGGEAIKLQVRLRGPSTSNARMGRPEKLFSELSDKAKKRKIGHLLEYSPAELLHAGVLASYAVGDRKSAKRVKSVLDRPDSAASEGTTSFSLSGETCRNARRAAIEEATAFFLENKGTKSLYSWNRMLGHDAIPPQYHLKALSHL